jgi:hypothetical protein
MMFVSAMIFPLHLPQIDKHAQHNLAHRDPTRAGTPRENGGHAPL